MICLVENVNFIYCTSKNKWIVIESIKMSVKPYPYVNGAFLGDTCKIFINN